MASAPAAARPTFSGIHGPSDEGLEAWASEAFAIRLLFEYVGLGQYSTQGICTPLGLDPGDGMELFGNIAPNELEETVLS